ncbi:MAG: hypothetical protein L6R36_008831 [Xanthoria steineri]|nr:MAG: hypothetical protein L6R36_008831 [Xanthoria steineri]
MSAATTISPSTTTSSSPPQDPPSRTWIPTSTPITLLPTPTARLYHHIHPILLLSLFYLSFPSLTANPVSTLCKLLLPITSLQILYCVLCLPIAKAGVLRVKPKPKPKPGVKKTRELGIVWEKVVPAILATLLTFLLATPLTTIILILFGAPLTTHLAHNLLCATHMALLMFQPLFYVYGVDAVMWKEVCSAFLPWDGVWGGTVGTAVGAWCGAAPIPLDWDRDWQKWPITIVTGAYIGWGIGRLAGEFLFKGMRIQFDT